MGDHGVGKTSLLQQFITSEYMGTADPVFGRLFKDLYYRLIVLFIHGSLIINWLGKLFNLLNYLIIHELSEHSRGLVEEASRIYFNVLVTSYSGMIISG